MCFTLPKFILRVICLKCGDWWRWAQLVRRWSLLFLSQDGGKIKYDNHFKPIHFPKPLDIETFYLHQTAKVKFSSLLVCLFVCLWTTLRKTREWIFMKFSGYVGHDNRNNLEHLDGVTFNSFSTGFPFLCFQGNPSMLATLPENGWMDFHDNFSKVCTWDQKQTGTFLGCGG